MDDTASKIQIKILNRPGQMMVEVGLISRYYIHANILRSVVSHCLIKRIDSRVLFIIKELNY